MFMLSGSKKWKVVNSINFNSFRTLFEPEQSESLYEGFCKEGKLKYVGATSKAPAHIERDARENDDISYFNSPVDLKFPDYERFPLLEKTTPKVCTLRAGGKFDEK